MEILSVSFLMYVILLLFVIILLFCYYVILLLCYYYFVIMSYLPKIAASEGRSLTTFFPTKMRGEEIATRTSTSFSHFVRVPVTPPLPSGKIIKNLRSTRKFKHVRHLRWLRALYFPHAGAKNSQYLVY